MERLVIKYNLARHYSQVGIICCPETNTIYCKNNSHSSTAVGIIVVHLFIEFR